MKIDVTREYINTQGLKVFFNDTTGNVSVENDSDIVFSIYDNGNIYIKSSVQNAIDEFNC